jgi:hypothetical protein
MPSPGEDPLIWMSRWGRISEGLSLGCSKQLAGLVPHRVLGRTLTDNCVLAFTGAGEWVWWAVAGAVALGIAGAILLVIARRARPAAWTILAVAAFALVAMGSSATPAFAASNCTATTPAPAVAITPPAITVDDVSVNEDSGVANVVITRTGTDTADIVLNVATQDGTAQAGSDYVAVDTDVTIPASDNPTETITVPIAIDADAVYEPDEQFGVVLTSVSGAIDSASDLDAAVTIVNDDPPPTVALSDVSVNEDSGVATVTITRAGATAQDIVLNVATQDGTAQAGSDYVAVDTDVTIPASDNPTETITVPIAIDVDAVYEPDEQFSVVATAVTGAIDSASDLSGAVTIVNDDPAPVISVHDVSVNEDTGVADLVITRTGATAQDITFQLTTHDQSATAGPGIGGNDYVPVSDTYTFAASHNATETITVPITINPDTIYEADEQFVVDLVPTTGTGTISGSSNLLATVTIVNDDPAPVISVHDVSVNEDTGVATLTITRTGATTGSIGFNLSTQDGTAQSGGSGPGSNDYDPIVNAHYTIPASNNANETLTVTVTINPDTVVENNETFTVNLNSVTGVISSSSDLSAVVTIVNVDASV